MSYVKTVRARKTHRCEEYPSGLEDCAGIIKPGDDYLLAIAYPDGDLNTGTVPWSLRLCVPCATRYGRTMPPRGKPTRQAGT